MRKNCKNSHKSKLPKLRRIHTSFFLVALYSLQPLHADYEPYPEIAALDQKYADVFAFMLNNAETSDGIWLAREEFEALIDKKMTALLKILPETERELLAKGQHAWEESMKLEEELYLKNSSNIRLRLGRETQIGMYMAITQRYRDRALLLTQHLAAITKVEKE